MPRTRRIIALLALTLLLAAPLTAALAQTAPIEVPSHDLAFQAPQGWTVQDQVDAEGLLTIELHHPSGGGVIVVAATVITPADQAYWSQPGHVLLTDVWTGFQPEVPGSQERQRYEATVGGLPAHVMDYASEQLGGTIVVAVGPVAAYTFISAADEQRLGEVHAALELVATSFAPPSLACGAAPPPPAPPAPPAPDAPANPLDPAPAAPDAAAPGANPLDPPAPANPLDAPADPPANPLERPADPPTNPLDHAAPAAVDPFVGRFADPEVTLVLEPSADGYAGELVVQGTPYPLTATLVDGRLDGSFRVGDQPFAFDAELSGDTLVLASDGARFVLQRVP